MTSSAIAEFNGDGTLFSLDFALADDFDVMATLWQFGCQWHGFGCQRGHELFVSCVAGIELS